ncbi:DNA gyrase inhibitor YacG [Desulfobacterota bacterium AH_259_B03_O07]|nr:DNA gyrase inhibitor YacG [Desulfobacterota bacterium AH_259_B03_O07]
MIVTCPSCGKSIEWEGNDWRPFCSERCKLVDLGAWITEEYKIPGETSNKEESKEENDR